MTKRESAREEAKFARGDVGVDGLATLEAAEEAEVQRGKAREQFLRGKAYLGREFLTWLLWRSESTEPIVDVGGQPLTLVLADRLVLRGIAGDVVETTMRGTTAPYSPLVKRALSLGLLVHQARLKLALGERQFEVTLDAEHVQLRSAKLPQLAEEKDDVLAERLELADELGALVQAMLEAFLVLRASRKWRKDAVPALKAWMSEGN